MTRPILYLSGPYPGHREIPREEIVGVAEHYQAQAEDAGWISICPSLWPEAEAWKSGMQVLERLDPAKDAILLLPRWLQDQRSITEHDRAACLRFTIYSPSVGDGSVIPVSKHALCPHYRRSHYEINDRDTCDADVQRCPAGAMCPIRERVRKGLTGGERP